MSNKILNLSAKIVLSVYIKKKIHIFSFFDNRFLLHILLYYPQYNIGYFNFLIFITRSQDFSCRYRRERCESAPGILTVPFFSRLHGSTPRYYNFVCADNPHSLPNLRKLLRVSDGETRESRGQDLQFFHFSAIRLTRGSTTNSKFPRN